MENRHPDSPLFDEVKSIYGSIVKAEKKEAVRQRLIAEKKEKEARLKKERLRRKKLAALKKLVRDYDDVDDITWYKNPYFKHYNNENLTSLYIGHSDITTWLRLKMSYRGGGWIFFKEAYLSYDGNTKQIIFDEYHDKTSDNNGGKVWEWIDVSVTEEMERFLRQFAKSKNAKMRLSGKYSRTRTLTWKERQGIIDILNGYDLLKKGIK